MSAARTQTAGKHSERGYALLVVIFLVSVLLISTMVVAPNILTEGRREKEKEMIWRGKQYTRGVKLYYRKLGRFPTSLDDLTKPKIGSLRFMRQAYKDPMNKEDGSWRFIYVGPAGQLIGSLKPQQNVQLFQGGGIGTPVGTDQSDAGFNPQSIPSGDAPTIIGGNIIGVGSKVNKSSIIVYDKARNYHLFEFIWDPSKDTFGVGQPGLQTGTGLGQQGGQGGSPGVPLGQNPTTPQPNPQQPPPQQ